METLHSPALQTDKIFSTLYPNSQAVNTLEFIAMSPARSYSFNWLYLHCPILLQIKPQRNDGAFFKKVKYLGGTKVFYKCVLCVFNKRRKVHIETSVLFVSMSLSTFKIISNLCDGIMKKLKKFNFFLISFEETYSFVPNFLTMTGFSSKNLYRSFHRFDEVLLFFHEDIEWWSQTAPSAASPTEDHISRLSDLRFPVHP